MDEPAAPIGDLVTLGPVVSPKRWPASFTFLTAGFYPKTTAVRTLHVGYLRAYAVHFTALLLTAVVLVFLDSWESAGTPPVLMSSLQAGGVFAVVEVSHLVLAGLSAPWGARDEPLRTSFGQALRRTWLHTPHLVLAILLPGLIRGSLVQAQREWWRGVRPPNLPVAPVPLSTRPSADPAAWQEYEAARQEYRAAVVEYHKAVSAYFRPQADKPWYVEYKGPLTLGATWSAGVWFLWAWLRSVGAPRPAAPSDRHPFCESCGYCLLHAAPEGRCPECGELVAASLGPGVRSGPPWEHRQPLGWAAAWWRCTINAMERPQEFARTLQVKTLTTVHRGFLVSHLVVLFLVVWFGVILCLMVAQGQGLPWSRLDEIGVIGPFLAALFVLVALFITLFAAMALGLALHVTEKRNLMAGSMQAAAYLAGYLVLWAAVIVSIGAVAIGGEKTIRAIFEGMGVHPRIAFLVLWLGPFQVLLLGYIRRMRRMAAGLRYANR